MSFNNYFVVADTHLGHVSVLFFVSKDVGHNLHAVGLNVLHGLTFLVSDCDFDHLHAVGQFDLPVGSLAQVLGLDLAVALPALRVRVEPYLGVLRRAGCVGLVAHLGSHVPVPALEHSIMVSVGFTRILQEPSERFGGGAEIDFDRSS